MMINELVYIDIAVGGVGGGRGGHGSYWLDVGLRRLVGHRDEDGGTRGEDLPVQVGDQY